MTRDRKQLRLINQAVEPSVRLWRAVLDGDVRARRCNAAWVRDESPVFGPGSKNYIILCAAAAVDPGDAWHTLTGDI